ncbi:ABC transporter ATP-binding protein [Patescibacteria group bacterium]
MKHKEEKTIQILLKTFSRYRLHLVLLTILGILGAVLEGIGISAVIPLFSFILGDGGVPIDPVSSLIKQFFDFVGVPFTIRFLLIFMAVLFLGRAVALIIFTYIRARIAASFTFREISQMLSGTLQAKWMFLAKQKIGYMQNTLFWDVRQSAGLLDALAQFIQSSTGFVIYFFIALNISPIITSITLVVGAVLLIGLRPFVHKTKVFGEQKSDLEKTFTDYLIEHLGGLKVVKASGIGQKVAGVGRATLEKLRTVYIKNAIVHSIATVIIQPLSMIFILVLFVFAYKLPSFNIGVFAAVLYLIQKIFTYLQSTQSSFHSIANFAPFASNILKFKNSLDENKDESKKDKKLPFVFKDSLLLDDVSFSYNKGAQVISNLSFSVPQKSFLGIIGPSGGGKTSVVDLILRLLSPSSGSISLDGVPIDEIKIDEWRQNIGYVSQDIFIMNTSIRDNIKFYDDSITDEEMCDAARKAHIYGHIVKLEDGFDTIVGDRGVSLSVGQRQRIVIARALARTPSILIFDEATSALDSESEVAIKETIEEMRKDITLIMIAHRISTIKNADKIIVLKDGVVAEEGKSQDMLNNPESYLSQMIKLQTFIN